MTVVLILGGSIVVSHRGFSFYFPGECWWMPSKSLMAVCMVCHEGSKYFIHLFICLTHLFSQCWSWTSASHMKVLEPLGCILRPCFFFVETYGVSYANLELTAHPKLVLDSLSSSLTSARIYYNCALPYQALSSNFNWIDHLSSVNWKRSFCIQSICPFFRCVTISSHHVACSFIYLVMPF